MCACLLIKISRLTDITSSSPQNLRIITCISFESLKLLLRAALTIVRALRHKAHEEEEEDDQKAGITEWTAGAGASAYIATCLIERLLDLKRDCFLTSLTGYADAPEHSALVLLRSPNWPNLVQI
jgi:hypothetical protein